MFHAHAHMHSLLVRWRPGARQLDNHATCHICVCPKQSDLIVLGIWNYMEQATGKAGALRLMLKKASLGQTI
jgi:hypothetical protein